MLGTPFFFFALILAGCGEEDCKENPTVVLFNKTGRCIRVDVSEYGKGPVLYFVTCETEHREDVLTGKYFYTISDRDDPTIIYRSAALTLGCGQWAEVFAEKDAITPND